MTRQPFKRLSRFLLLFAVAGVCLGLVSDPVTAMERRQAFEAQADRTAAISLPGTYTRFKHTFSVERSQKIKRFVERYENASHAAVMGSAGVLCALVALPSGPLGSGLVGASCVAFVSVYWGAFKDAINHMTAKKPRLRIMERCNMLLLNQCVMRFDPVPK